MNVFKPFGPNKVQLTVMITNQKSLGLILFVSFVYVGDAFRIA